MYVSRSAHHSYNKSTCLKRKLATNCLIEAGRIRMTEETFEGFVHRERDRLRTECEEIYTQQKELEDKLADLNRQLAAIDAYQAARSGKNVAGRQPPKGGRQARQGSKRDA